MPLIIMPAYSSDIDRVSDDPYISKVGLLMHMEGGVLVDSTGRHQFTINPSGATLSTAQKLFGSQSLLINGTSDLPVTAPTHDDFDLGAGDFTIEVSIYPTNTSSLQPIMGPWRTGGTSTSFNYSWILYAYNSGVCFGFSESGIYESNNNRMTDLSTGVISANRWSRIAVVRNGTNIRLYVNGTYVPFSSGGNNLPAGRAFVKPNSVFAIGGNTDTQHFSGYIDEVRITKGIARYTEASYVISPAPFPE